MVSTFYPWIGELTSQKGTKHPRFRAGSGPRRQLTPSPWRERRGSARTGSSGSARQAPPAQENQGSARTRHLATDCRHHTNPLLRWWMFFLFPFFWWTPKKENYKKVVPSKRRTQYGDPLYRILPSPTHGRSGEGTIEGLGKRLTGLMDPCCSKRR